jgi:hypothetical protein
VFSPDSPTFVYATPISMIKWLLSAEINRILDSISARGIIRERCKKKKIKILKNNKLVGY